MAIYKGFSSYEFQRNKEFILTDVQLVEFDILGHIYTRKGERVDIPDWGSLIPDMLFEQMTVENVEVIRNELDRIIDFDPRVKKINLTVTPDYDNLSIIASARLFYVELDIAEDFTLHLEFET